MFTDYFGNWFSNWFGDAEEEEPEPPRPPVTYMAAPDISDEDEAPAFTSMDFARMWIGAQQSGIASGPLVDSTK